MPNKTAIKLDEGVSEKTFFSQVSRRRFLNYAGLTAGAMVFASSCKKDLRGGESASDFAHEDPHNKPKNTVNLGSGDIGVLNYAYALEQLEAAFYAQVNQTPYAGISGKEADYLQDIRQHEIAHREFLKNVLGDKAIGTLLLDFSSINFSSRDSVLATAKAFEDVGVSAYNGAGQLLQSPDYLLYAGKIVSVEARHAACLRDLISYGSFADSTAVNSMGLDLVRTPTEVLAIASTYIKTKIIANNLPTS
ncbi:MAG: ferritin-like domain-containing protein [Chitinophagaceae bacterium]|nr:ferritin-like domain-containing protein [Chitinophagaceae bacterium]